MFHNRQVKSTAKKIEVSQSTAALTKQELDAIATLSRETSAPQSPGFTICMSARMEKSCCYVIFQWELSRLAL